MWFEMRDLLERGLIQLPDDSKVINELGVVKYHRSTSDRTVQVEKKDKIKERLGHSPDYADSFIYCFAGSGFGFQTSGLAGV